MTQAGDQPVRAAPARGDPPRLQARRSRSAGSCRARCPASAGVYGAAQGLPRPAGSRSMRRLGVVGTLVWDMIHGRDPVGPPVEEWGGIAYALGGLDAALAADWEIVPLIKVGRDLAPQAARLPARTLARLAPGRPLHRGARPEQPGGAPLSVGGAALRADVGRRARRGPGPELGPAGARSRRALRQLHLRIRDGPRHGAGAAPGLPGPDLRRPAQPAFSGCSATACACSSRCPMRRPGSRCFDVLQVNEDEMRQLSPDPLALAATALGAGVALLVVTLGARGVVYFAAPGFDGLGSDRAPAAGDTPRPDRTGPGARRSTRSIRPGAATSSARPASPGCWRATGAETAHPRRQRAAARNAALRGASGLARHLRGELRGRRDARRRGAGLTSTTESFEQFAQGFGAWPPEDRMLFDARGAPVGVALRPDRAADRRPGPRTRRGATRPLFTVPASDEVQPLLGPDRLLPPRRRAVRACTARCPASRRREQSDRAARRHAGARRRRTCTRWSAGSRRRRGPDPDATSWGSTRRPRWDSRWHFRRHVRILWSTPAPAAGWRSRPTPSASGSGGGWSVIAVSDAGIGFRRSLESHAGQAVRRPLGRRRGARGGADPGREPVPRSGPRPGLAGDQALSRPVGRQDLDPQRHGADRDRARRGTTTSRSREHLPFFPGLAGADRHSGPGRTEPR